MVTGAAGFIGAEVSLALQKRGCIVVGVDNLSDYYDPTLKVARLARLEGGRGFRFECADLADPATTQRLFERWKPVRVVHLAAQPGVARSLEEPFVYGRDNLLVTLNVLEQCGRHGVEHLVYASSSSVYGAGARTPFSVHAAADHPVSLYAATKRSNELMAHSYSYNFDLPVTGLRLFTVYGPWGRPDMAYYRFAQKMLRGEPITVYGDGTQSRDFTYIGDVVDGVLGIADRIPESDPAWRADMPDPATSRAPYRIYNIGRGKQVSVNHLIEQLEKHLGVGALRRYEPERSVDVRTTHAEVEDLAVETAFRATTDLEQGIARFVEWFARYQRGGSE